MVIGVDMDNPVKLGSIKKSFRCPRTKEKYTILGAVEYRGPPVIRKSAEEIGHYIGISRRYTTWIGYDDKKKNSYSVSDDYSLIVELLFYTKL